MPADILIRAEGVSKKFCRDLRRSMWYGVKDTVHDLLGRDGHPQGLRSGEFWAVDNVSFALRRGECLGLIGHNGAGKTTLLKMLNGLIKPDSGRIEIRGRVGALIALGAGFNPILTGRENIYINGSVLGLTRREIEKHFDDIIDFAAIGDFIDAPVQSYSSGMQVRLGFAIATALSPDILLLDEVLAVGDANFQAKCYDRVGRLLERSAVILVSHVPYHIRKVCDQVLLMDRGRSIAEGAPEQILALHGDLVRDGGENALTILGDNVTSAIAHTPTKLLRSGEVLDIRLRLDLRSSTRCDQGYLNIVDLAGNVHAQVLLDHFTHRPLPQGRSELRICVGPLHLSRGQFRCHVILWTRNGKKTLVQLRNALAFDNEGPTSMGPFYYPPATATVVAENPTLPAPAQ